MKLLRPFLAAALALCFAVASAQTTAPGAKAAAPAPKPDASAAIEKPDTTGRFRKAHESFLARGKAGPIGVLFLGDSITAGWASSSRTHIWETYYGKWQPANFGIGGDQTQHVIWRIENGELDGIAPKVVVLMLGTNNSRTHTAAEIAAADKKIVGLIRAKLPNTKVLVLAVFPRGPRKDKDGKISAQVAAEAARQMEVINGVNAELAKLDDGQQVRFLDINEVFLGQDGKIPFSVMPDQLHPNTAGYQLWADAMQPTLTAMMK
jgi:lysophospholipase L1-like esterase